MKRLPAARALGALLVLSVLSPACALKDALRPAGPPPAPLSRQRPALGPGQLAVTWLGAAGVLIRGRDRTVAFDPYVTRAWAPRMFLGNLRPDEAAVDKWIPPVDLVLVGHAHADHALDAPYLVQRDGAPLVGTTTMANVARSYGVPSEQIHVMGGGDTLEVAGLRVHATRVDHVKLPLVKVPTNGVMHRAEGGPLRERDFKAGGTLFYRVIIDGIRVGHLSSTEAPRHLPDDLGVDVLFMSVAMTKRATALPAFLPRTRPTFVVPIHFDMFFLDLEEQPRMAPGSGMEDVPLEISTAWPGARVITPSPMRERILDFRTKRWR